MKLLAKMFGAKDSELASQNKPLWQCYLGRYSSCTTRPITFFSVYTNWRKTSFYSKTKLQDSDHLGFLWFLRFNDIHVPVRLECVKFASHCLMNHPDLAKDLTGTNCFPSNFDYHYISQLSIKVHMKLKLTLFTFLIHVFGLIVHSSSRCFKEKRLS